MKWQRRILGGLLVLLPLSFVAGHMLSAGAVWNHAAGEPFSPWRNWVSDYAYRSPVWPVFVACMYAMAVLLAAVSWRIFRLRQGPAPLVWSVTLLLSYGALKLIEVALFPVKPPEIRIEELQARMDRSSWERMKDEAVEAYRRVRGHRSPARDTAAEVVAAFESNSGHVIGIRAGMAGILGAMILALGLPYGRRWRMAALGCLIVAAGGGLFAAGEWHGLWQRVAFVGVYAWLALTARRLFQDGDAAGGGAAEASR